MSRIVVDAGDLEYLAEVLDQTKHELELLGTRMRTYDTALGDDRVRRGVDRVISNWSDVREKVTSELETLKNLLSDAAREYRSVEQEIVAATAAESPPPPPESAAGG
jgi:hypothetical protein